MHHCLLSPLPTQRHSITVVIPSFNEEGNLDPLCASIQRAFQQLGFTLPVLLVDDGSTDNSPQILAKLQQHYSFLQVVRHDRKRGVKEVWKTALAHTQTDWILWEQADLESDPETDIPLLLQAYTPDVHAVAGWRQQRQDGKNFSSTIANRACRAVFGLKIHDMNWIKLVRRDLVATLPLDIVTHRYLLAVLAGMGYRITEVSTPWHHRRFGVSKFGKGRLIASALDFLRTCCWFYGQSGINALIKLRPTRSEKMTRSMKRKAKSVGILP